MPTLDNKLFFQGWYLVEKNVEVTVWLFEFQCGFHIVGPLCTYIILFHSPNIQIVVSLEINTNEQSVFEAI